MTHHITAIIGREDSIAQVRSRFELPGAIPLPQGLAIVPLGQYQIDSITDLDPGRYANGFTYLSSRVETWLQHSSVGSRVLYVETDYFGGIGGQAAALFEDGRASWKAGEGLNREPTSLWHKLTRSLRKRPKSPISQGLAALGVKVANEFDEFDAVGLGSLRTMESLGLSEFDDE